MARNKETFSVIEALIQILGSGSSSEHSNFRSDKTSERKISKKGHRQNDEKSNHIKGKRWSEDYGNEKLSKYKKGNNHRIPIF